MATQEEKIVVKTEVTELAKLRANLKEASNEFLKLKGSLPAAELKVLENNVRSASTQLKAANDDIRRLTGASKNHALQNLQTAASYVGLGIGIQQVIQLSKEAVNAYAQEETSIRTLEFSITKVVGGNEQLVKSLEDYASATQTRVSLDDEVIRQQEAFLVLQGRSEEQIKAIIDAAIDLSAVQGDLSNENVIENVKKLDGTYEGVVGKLGKYDDRLKTLTQTQLQNGDAVKILGDKYKGTADEINKGAEGNLRKLKIWYNESLEIIGGYIVKFGGVAQIWLTLTSEIEKNDFAMRKWLDDLKNSANEVPVLGGALSGLIGIYQTLTNSARIAGDAIRNVIPNTSNLPQGSYDVPLPPGYNLTLGKTWQQIQEMNKPKLGGKTRVDNIREENKELEKQVEITKKLIDQITLLVAPKLKTIDEVIGSFEISPRTIAQDDPMRHLFDERIQKEIELYQGEIAAAEKTLSIFQDSVNLLEGFFGVQLPKEFDLLMNMLSQFIQGLGGGGSGLFGFLGNLAMSFIPGGQLLQAFGSMAQPAGLINRPVSNNPVFSPTFLVNNRLNRYAEIEIVRVGTEQLNINR